MADDVDRAQEINEQLLDDALADHRRRMPPGLSLTFCQDCDTEIPEKRRQAAPGCTRCVACQESHEIHSHWRAL